MSNGIASSDITRLARTIEYHRRAIEAQTAMLRHQNDLMDKYLTQQAQILGVMQDAQEDSSSTSSSQEGGNVGGREASGSGGLGEG